MSTTTTIATVTLITAAAIGVAYFTQPHWFSSSATATTAPAPSANTSNAPPATAEFKIAQSATPPADAKLAPAEAANPPSWVGLPVISADGTTIGQVTETRPHADGRSFVLLVKGSDGKTYDVSSAISTMQGRAVQVAATATEIGKMIR